MHKMFRVLVALLLASHVRSDCRLTDIANIIGGSDYEVLNMQATHVTVGPVNLVVITNTVQRVGHTDNNVLLSVFDYSMCNSFIHSELVGVNQGITDISSFTTDLVVMGSNLELDGSYAEVVIVVQVDKPDNPSLRFAEGFKQPINLASQTQFVGSWYSHQTPPSQTPSFFAARQNNIRMFDRGISQFKQYNLTGKKILSFTGLSVLDQMYPVAVSVSTSATQIDFYQPFNLDALTHSVTVTQSHGGNGQAKMAVSGDFAVKVQTCVAIYDFGALQTLVSVINTLPTASPGIYASTAREYQIATWLNVFFVQFDPQTGPMFPQLIAMDSSNQVYMFHIDTSAFAVVNLKMSGATNHMSQYAASGSIAKLVYAKSFDFFLLGVTSSIVFTGKTYSFAKPVGFVMSLEKNRKNALLSPSTSLTVASSTPLVATVNTVNPLSPPAAIGLLPFDPNLVFLVPPPVQFNKWTEQISACTKYSSNFQSYCYFYKFLPTYKNVTNDNPGTPTASSNCPQHDVFHYSEYPQLTPADQNIRSTCYPHYSEYTSFDNIPSNPISPMLMVDSSTFQIKWNQTISEEVVGNVWVYAAEEKGAQRSLVGYFANAVFGAMGVSNHVVEMQSDQSWEKQLVQQDEWPLFGIKINCWSKLCPSFVHFNPANFTLYTLAVETYGQKVNGTFIYEVEKTTLLTGESSRQTFTIIMSLASLPSVTSLINITMPFDIWYKLKKDKIPFYSPPIPSLSIPSSTSNAQSAISNILSSDDLNQLVEEFGEEATDELNQWTDDEILKAYEEARERLRKPATPISVKAMLDSVGLLEIKFSLSVSFPSYLVKEFVQKQRARDLGSSLFWPANGFQKNELSGPRTPPPSVTPTSFGSVTGSLVNSQVNLVPSTDPLKAQAPLTQPTGGPVPYGINGAQQKPAAPGAGPGSQLPGGQNGPAGPGNKTGPVGPGGPGNGSSGGGPTGNPKGPGGKGDGPLIAGGPGPLQNGPGKNPSDQQNGNNKNVQNVPQGQNKDGNSGKKDQAAEVQCSMTEYKDTDGKCKPLEIYFGPLSSLFKVVLSPSEQTTALPDVRQLGLEFTQEIKNVTDSVIQIQFNFTDPLQVSPADTIYIEIDFGKFEKGLARSVKISLPCSRQVVQGSATDTVAAISQASTAATTSAVVGSAVLQTLMSGCLAQIWGMINGIQFIINLPALNVDFPPNAFIVINKILNVATFDIPYINMDTLGQKAFPMPTEDTIFTDSSQANLKAALSGLGFQSAYMSRNLGSMFVIWTVMLTGLLLSVMLEICSRFMTAAALNRRIKTWLHWNFVIRFLLEGTFQISFCCYLNFSYGKISSKIGSWFNFASTTILGVCLALMPCFFLIFYLKNFDRLGDYFFEKKFGATYEGLKTNQKTVLAYPVYFIVRRVTFVTSCLSLYKYVLIQIILTIVTTMASACYLLHFSPFNDPLVGKLEVMNECFTLCLLFLLFCFTPIVPRVQDQYTIGYFFLVGLCGCISVHLFFLFKDIARMVLLKYKRFRYRKQNPHLFARDKQLSWKERFARRFRKPSPAQPESSVSSIVPSEEASARSMPGVVKEQKRHFFVIHEANKESESEEQSCEKNDNKNDENSQSEVDDDFDYNRKAKEQLVDQVEDIENQTQFVIKRKHINQQTQGESRIMSLKEAQFQQFMLSNFRVSMVTYQNHESEEDQAKKQHIMQIKQIVKPMTRLVDKINQREQTAVDIEFQ